MTETKEGEEYFKDEDFEENSDHSGGRRNKKTKKITYKDVIRRDALGKMDDQSNESDSEGEDRDRNIFKKSGKETLAEEEARIKAEFKKAARVDSNNSSEKSS